MLNGITLKVNDNYDFLIRKTDQIWSKKLNEL